MKVRECGHLGHGEPPPLGGPPLAHLGDHAHQGVGVDGRGAGVVAGAHELPAEEVVDALGEIVDDACQAAAGVGAGRVAGQHREARRLLLGVRHEGQHRALVALARRAFGDRLGHPAHQQIHLAIHDGCVEAFLRPEVLVDDGLAHPGALGDLLDGGLVTLGCEHLAADLHQLGPPVRCGQPLLSLQVGLSPVLPTSNLPASNHESP